MSGAVREARMEEDQRAERAAVGKREVHWSARRKEELVMRLLLGESLDLLAREPGQPAGRLAAWRVEPPGRRSRGLKSQPAVPEDRALADAQRKVGEQAMEIDIRRALLEKKGDPQLPRCSR